MPTTTDTSATAADSVVLSVVASLAPTSSSTSTAQTAAIILGEPASTTTASTSSAQLTSDAGSTATLLSSSSTPASQAYSLTPSSGVSTVTVQATEPSAPSRSASTTTISSPGARTVTVITYGTTALAPTVTVTANAQAHAQSHVSGGEIAGIIVGALAALVMALGFGWFFVRRKRSSKGLAGEDADTAATTDVSARFETDGEGLKELPADAIASEAASEPVREMHVEPQELDGDLPEALRNGNRYSGDVETGNGRHRGKPSLSPPRPVQVRPINPLGPRLSWLPPQDLVNRSYSNGTDLAQALDLLTEIQRLHHE